MQLKNRYRFLHTLSFRLTLWYSFIFFILILLGFFFFNLLLSSSLNKELDQSLLGEAKEISLLLERKSIHHVRSAMQLEAESEGVQKVFYRLMNRNGDTIASTDATRWKIGPGRKAINSILGGDEHFFETISIPGSEYEARALYSRLGKDHILQIMITTEETYRFLAVFRQIFMVIMGIMFILSTVVGWFMARRALSGVEEVTETAIQVTDGLFDKRVRITGQGEELDRLATTFNLMLEKLHTLITDIKETNDNIAHDLRSPVTRIRGIAETTLMSARSDKEYEAMAGSIIEECDGLLIMINTMLYISQAEAGVSKLDISDVDLSQIISEACELFQPIAEDKDIKIIQKTERAIVMADKEKIQRVIANLLDNALKYTPENGAVTFTIIEDHDKMTVSVEDTGIGISSEDLPRVFNRFYRCDSSRSLQGVGLGLSLAKAIIQAHHGEISVSSEQEKGSVFTFTIPKATL
ncbi:MAG: HAMP domain-containing protein [Deltaproteobacteria bacterium]|nr:HAMP domain-containing protein [Deltaproteobacteria bacterium]